MRPIIWGGLLQQEPAREHIGNMIWRIDPSMMLEISDFVTSNMPYFLEEEDYKTMDSLVQPRVIESAWNKLKKPCSPLRVWYLKNTLLKDPLLFSGPMLEKLQGFRMEDRFMVHSDYIFSRGRFRSSRYNRFPLSHIGAQGITRNSLRPLTGPLKKQKPHSTTKYKPLPLVRLHSPYQCQQDKTGYLDIRCGCPGGYCHPAALCISEILSISCSLPFLYWPDRSLLLQWPVS
jgi:hypothetical protein